MQVEFYLTADGQVFVIVEGVATGDSKLRAPSKPTTPTEGEPEVAHPTITGQPEVAHPTIGGAGESAAPTIGGTSESAAPTIGGGSGSGISWDI